MTHICCLGMAPCMFIMSSAIISIVPFVSTALPLSILFKEIYKFRSEVFEH